MLRGQLISAMNAAVPSSQDEVRVTDAGGRQRLAAAFEESLVVEVLIDGEPVLCQQDELGVLRVAYQNDLMPKGLSYRQITAAVERGLAIARATLDYQAQHLSLMQWYGLRDACVAREEGAVNLWASLVEEVAHEIVVRDQDHKRLDAMIDSLRDMEHPHQAAQEQLPE